ncbi:MAG: hypothetical protein O2943_04240 [Actinomycetota bacterium]|nr:hypothetical protein [Actinomycetota bacterium]
MRRNMKFAALAGAAALTIAGLSACSSGSTTADATSAASPEASMVGGMTTCDLAALDSSLQAAAQALGQGNVVTDASVECADGWAVVTGILGTSETAADAPQGAPTSFIFEAEGQFWIPKAVAAVCGTASGTEVPADALIPAALYPSGCLAG